MVMAVGSHPSQGAPRSSSHVLLAAQRDQTRRQTRPHPACKPFEGQDEPGQTLPKANLKCTARAKALH